MSEQTFFLALIIGVLGASVSLGLAVGAKNAGERITRTEIRIDVADVVKVQIKHYDR